MKTNINKLFILNYFNPNSDKKKVYTAPTILNYEKKYWKYTFEMDLTADIENEIKM
jgi:hypothetical protein